MAVWNKYFVVLLFAKDDVSTDYLYTVSEVIHFTLNDNSNVQMLHSDSIQYTLSRAIWCIF